jgi:exodeoxyribonuclease VII small subunit
MAGSGEKEEKFEQALQSLEGVVERLESGELSLEESLSAFEEGVRLVKFCNHKLNEVEKRIEVLVKDKEGRLQLKLLDELAEKGADAE